MTLAAIKNNMLRSIVLTAVILLTPTTCSWAQVNIENVRESEAQKGLSTTIKLDLATRLGNVDITTLAVDTRMDWIGGKNKSFLLARGDFGWFDGDRFSNGGLLHIRYTHFLSNIINLEGFGQIDYDKSRFLDFRGVAGMGPRISLYRQSGIKAVWGTSYMLEHERYNLPAGARHPKEETVHRWSNYLNIAASMTETLDVTWIIYSQPRFSDFADIRLLSEAKLSVRISRYLSLTNTFRLRYDSDPPDGIEDLDSALLVGLQGNF
jgi:putative salt-induced outer membrane protein YdiY